jgi:hypothetical protein
MTEMAKDKITTSKAEIMPDDDDISWRPIDGDTPKKNVDLWYPSERRSQSNCFYDNILGMWVWYTKDAQGNDNITMYPKDIEPSHWRPALESV